MLLIAAAPLLAATAVAHDPFVIDPAFSAERLAAAPSGWPTPDWSTVPTFTFCGPGARPFQDAPDELQFFAGTNTSRRKPRWYALGYDTLTQWTNSSMGFVGSDPSIKGQTQCGNSAIICCVFLLKSRRKGAINPVLLTQQFCQKNRRLQRRPSEAALHCIAGQGRG